MVAKTIDGQYLTLKDYIKVAQRVLAKNKLDPRNEENISIVVEYMVKADQKYDGMTGTRIGYRMVNAKYGAMVARQKYLARINNKKKNKILSLDYLHDINSERPHCLYDSVACKDVSQETRVMCEDIVKVAKKIMGKRQFQCFYLKYVENYMTKDICKEMGITRAMVSLHIIGAKEKLAEYFND
jgi:RNA polymerase sigma factor (sigma-70 family)